MKFGEQLSHTSLASSANSLTSLAPWSFYLILYAKLNPQLAPLRSFSPVIPVLQRAVTGGKMITCVFIINMKSVINPDSLVTPGDLTVP